MGQTTVSWEQADRLAIRTDSSDGEAWHAGHVNDVLPLADGGLLLATDSGGVWHVRRATRTGSAFARPYSDDWDNPDLMCLASIGGIVLAGCQSSAGTTERLYETRDSLAADAVVSPTWRPVNAPTKVGTIYRIAVASVMDRLRVVLAADGGLFWSNITVEGLPYVWTQISTQACSAVAFGPGGSVLASTLSGGQILRFAWSGPANAATLAPQAVGLPRKWQQRMPRLGLSSLAACGGDPRQMYCVAAYNNPKTNTDTFIRALARSNDGGAQWTFLDAKCDGATLYSAGLTGAQGGYDNCIAVSPTHPDTVVIGWVSLFISSDGGKNFQRHQGGTRLHADVHAVTFDPAHPSHLYVGSDGGVARTTDVGHSFTASYNKQLRNLQFASAPEREFYGSSTVSPAVPGLIAGGLQDNGVVYGMPRVTPWRSAQGGDGGLGMFIAPGQLVSAAACCPGGSAGISKSHSALELGQPSTIPIRGRGSSKDDSGLPDPVAARLQSGSALTRAGQRMYAVGGNGQPQQMLYGLFADADGGHAAWRRLAALTGSPPPAIWSVASAHGNTVFVGTATGADKKGNVTPAGVYRVDDGRGPATQLAALPTFSGGSSDSNGIVSAIALRSALSPLIAYNAGSQGVVLRLRGTGSFGLVVGRDRASRHARLRSRGRSARRRVRGHRRSGLFQPRWRTQLYGRVRRASPPPALQPPVLLPPSRRADAVPEHVRALGVARALDHQATRGLRRRLRPRRRRPGRWCLVPRGIPGPPADHARASAGQPISCDL